MMYLKRLSLFYLIREELWLLSNIACNISQVVKMANQTRNIYATDMIKLQEKASNIFVLFAISMYNYVAEFYLRIGARYGMDNC